MSKPTPDYSSPRIDAGMPDYSSPSGDDFVALSRDRFPVHSMRREDLDAIVRIDRKITGRDRHAYYEGKLDEVMGQSGVRVSLVAEADGMPVGFVMARVDFGEFGRVEPAAVIDTICVDPDHGRAGVGRALMSQLMANLVTLRVETVRTEVNWDDFGILNFLKAFDFAPAQRLVLSKQVD